MSEEQKGGFQIIFNGESYEVQPYRGQIVTWRENKEEADELCRLLNDMKPSHTTWGDQE